MLQFLPYRLKATEYIDTRLCQKVHGPSHLAGGGSPSAAAAGKAPGENGALGNCSLGGAVQSRDQWPASMHL